MRYFWRIAILAVTYLIKCDNYNARHCSTSPDHPDPSTPSLDRDIFGRASGSVDNGEGSKLWELMDLNNLS